jgi:hypothetical protein
MEAGPGVQQREGHPMMRSQVEHGEAMRMRRLGRARVAALGGWMALLVACGPDPEGKFGDFVKDATVTEGQSSTGGPSPTGEPGSTSYTGVTEATGGIDAYDINGDFLLAVSTTVDRTKPLQFIATNTVTETDGKLVLSTCLQPLSLTMGKVTVPREPIGDPLCFDELEIADNKFTVDAGVVMVTGMANPITGSDIVASLVMAAEIQSDDLYCGTVSGMVMMPLELDIMGSSFAAVRLADKAVLPKDVLIDCMGTTLTDK